MIYNNINIKEYQQLKKKFLSIVINKKNKKIESINCKQKKKLFTLFQKFDKNIVLQFILTFKPLNNIIH